MATDDEYRHNAAYAQRQADATVNAADRASWLRMAASWLGMIKPSAAQNASDKFNAEVKEQGTGQTDSESSH